MCVCPINRSIISSVCVCVCVCEREREREREFQQLVYEVSALENDGVRSYGSHVDNTVQQEDGVQRCLHSIQYTIEVHVSEQYVHI